MADRYSQPGASFLAPSPPVKPPSATGKTVKSVKIRGELDIDTAPAVREQLNDLIEAGHTYVIINLEEVQYLDSTALGVLLTIMKRIVERQGRLALVSSNPKINRVFSITGVSRILSIYDTEQAALESFESREEGDSLDIRRSVQSRP